MTKKTPKKPEPAAEQKREPGVEVLSSPFWAQRHWGLVLLLIVCGIIGLALLYEFLTH